MNCAVHNIFSTTKYSSAYYIWILNGQSNSLYGSISTVKPVQLPHNHGSFVMLGNRVFHTPEITEVPSAPKIHPSSLYLDPTSGQPKSSKPQKLFFSLRF